MPNMKKKIKKVNAAILIIGNEILSGRTQDKNISFISQWLNAKCGISVNEVRIIPDDEKKIIENILILSKKFNYVFTTGGIGPTHDDITAQSISKAFKVKYEYHKEAYAILEKYYGKKKFNDGRKKMAKMPQGASLIYNPASGAPGFIVKNVFCLPGVPSILKSMVYGLSNKIIGGKKILSKTISVRTVESEIAKSLAGIQNKFKDVEIGSYPFFRLGKIGVSIVIRSTSKKQIDYCHKQIVSFLKKKEISIIER